MGTLNDTDFLPLVSDEMGVPQGNVRYGLALLLLRIMQYAHVIQGVLLQQQALCCVKWVLW